MDDYTKLPRSLVYKDRTNLKDFGVQNPGTINKQLFTNLKSIFMACEGAMEIALRCFNNAYYVCTLILLEDFPELRVAEYEAKLLEEEKPCREDVCAASMGMVCELLRAYDAKWREEDNDLIRAIRYRFSHYQWMHMAASSSFTKMADSCKSECYYVSNQELSPRSICEAIETVPLQILISGAEYVCERLALLEDEKKWTYGLDMSIARLHDDMREICEESDYIPKTDKFKSDGGTYDISDLDWEDKVRASYKLRKETVDYFSQHYPTEGNNHSSQPKSATHNSTSNAAVEEENRKLKEQLEKTINLLNATNEENAKLKKEVEELSEPIESLDAEQKVRMAFTLQLLKASGLTEETLKKRGNKQAAATIMSLLLAIHSESKNPAQICANFINDSRYYPKRNLDILIKLNTLCADLGINVCLKLG